MTEPEATMAAAVKTDTLPCEDDVVLTAWIGYAADHPEHVEAQSQAAIAKMALGIKVLRSADYLLASEESLALFVDILSRILGRASVAHHELKTRRLRHVQEDDPKFTPTSNADSSVYAHPRQ